MRPIPFGGTLGQGFYCILPGNSRLLCTGGIATPGPATFNLENKVVKSVNNFLANGLIVKDVLGYWSEIDGNRTFKLTKLILSDGTEVWIEGEHDYPYLADHRVLVAPSTT